MCIDTELASLVMKLHHYTLYFWAAFVEAFTEYIGKNKSFQFSCFAFEIQFTPHMVIPVQSHYRLFLLSALGLESHNPSPACCPLLLLSAYLNQLARPNVSKDG